MSCREHLRSNTKEFQLLGRPHGGGNSNASMQSHAEWGVNKKSLDALTCRAIISLTLGRYGRGAPMTEVLEWKDAGSLGRIGWADNERISVTNWSA